MKNIFISVFLFLAAFACLHVEAASLFEFRTAAFIPSSKSFKDIYGNVAPSYEIAAAKGLSSHWEAWANLDLFFGEGNVTNCGATDLDIYTVSVGLGYIYPLSSRFDFYLGIGPNVANILLRNHCCCGGEKISKCGFGGALKSGIRLYHSSLFLDLFVDYFYQRVRFDKWVNTGGIKSGMGIGIEF